MRPTHARVLALVGLLLVTGLSAPSAAAEETTVDRDGDEEITLPAATAATERIRASGPDMTLAQGKPGLTDHRVEADAGTDGSVGEGINDRPLAEGTLVVLDSTETPTMTFEGDGGLAMGVVGLLAVGGLFVLLIVVILIDIAGP